MKKIQVYDTTLRDGAQGEGVSFSAGGKLRVAQRLDEFGMDYIEGGYAGSNEKDTRFFREIRGEHLKHAKVVAFGNTRRARTRVAADTWVRSLVQAQTPVVCVVGKTWLLHVRDVLRTTPRENLAMISDTVRFLKDAGREVFFDAEHFFDGYRKDNAYAMDAIEAAVEAGADAVVLCDSTGGCLTHEVGEIVRKVAQASSVRLGFHGHNDMGLAVANTLEAVRAGVTQVQGTVNGYGERCGNADLCSVVPSLRFRMGCRCVKDEQIARLRELSLFVDDMANARHDPRAPYVGRSAFTHKGGAHADAVRKNPRSYEHLNPRLVGNDRRILVSELSGGSNVLLKAIELGAGQKESAEGAAEILKALKDLEHKGYSFEAADASFRILIQKALKKHKSFFDLEGFRVIVEKRGRNEPCLSEATIKVRVKDEIAQTVAEGDGPVNALDGALRGALARFYPEIAQVALTDFHVSILDPEEATAATTRVLIESGDGQDTWRTIGVSPNIIEASWQALVDSVEYKLFREEEAAKRKPRRHKAAGRARRGAR
ncbi:MAG: citramalate synthase [Verrucomicrobiota bacterium]|nr:citramalate synthase [Verrucomicrobiota bacterium]